MVKKKGFTLIEILVVVGLFGIIAVIGSGSFFSLLRGSTKSKTASAVKQNGDYALNVMERMIRNARYIETCEMEMTKIKIKNVDGGSTEFNCGNNTISSNSGELISGGLTVSNCAFNCRKDLNALNPDVVTIIFTLLSGASTGHPEEGAVIDFKTTVSLRNIPE